MGHVMRKSVFGDLRQGRTQTSLLSYSLEILSMKSMERIKKYADQTALMHRLICVFVFRIWQYTGFLPIFFSGISTRCQTICLSFHL